MYANPFIIPSLYFYLYKYVFCFQLGISPTTSFDAFHLKPGASYKFRVTPRNRYGWGESVVTSNPIIAGCAMFPPDIKRDLSGQLRALQGSNLTLDCEVWQFIVYVIYYINF